MEYFEAGARPARTAPEKWFTGTVLLEPLVAAPPPARVEAVRVTFLPGARTNWHTHPLGQAIHVVSGIGRCQRAGGPVVEIRAGDTVWFAPDERHWHGAAPDQPMCHIAIHEAKDGSTADWQEPVSEADYAAAPGAG